MDKLIAEINNQNLIAEKIEQAINRSIVTSTMQVLNIWGANGVGKKTVVDETTKKTKDVNLLIFEKNKKNDMLEFSEIWNAVQIEKYTKKRASDFSLTSVTNISINGITLGLGNLVYKPFEILIKNQIHKKNLQNRRLTEKQNYIMSLFAKYKKERNIFVCLDYDQWNLESSQIFNFLINNCSNVFSNTTILVLSEKKVENLINVSDCEVLPIPEDQCLEVVKILSKSECMPDVDNAYIFSLTNGILENIKAFIEISPDCSNEEKSNKLCRLLEKSIKSKTGADYTNVYKLVQKLSVIGPQSMREMLREFVATLDLDTFNSAVHSSDNARLTQSDTQNVKFVSLQNYKIILENVKKNARNIYNEHAEFLMKNMPSDLNKISRSLLIADRIDDAVAFTLAHLFNLYRDNYICTIEIPPYITDYLSDEVKQYYAEMQKMYELYRNSQYNDLLNYVSVPIINNSLLRFELVYLRAISAINNVPDLSVLSAHKNSVRAYVFDKDFKEKYFEAWVRANLIYLDYCEYFREDLKEGFRNIERIDKKYDLNMKSILQFFRSIACMYSNFQAARVHVKSAYLFFCSANNFFNKYFYISACNYFAVLLIEENLTDAKEVICKVEPHIYSLFSKSGIWKNNKLLYEYLSNRTEKTKVEDIIRDSSLYIKNALKEKKDMSVILIMASNALGFAINSNIENSDVSEIIDFLNATYQSNLEDYFKYFIGNNLFAYYLFKKDYLRSSKHWTEIKDIVPNKSDESFFHERNELITSNLGNLSFGLLNSKMQEGLKNKERIYTDFYSSLVLFSDLQVWSGV